MNGVGKGIIAFFGISGALMVLIGGFLRFVGRDL